MRNVDLLADFLLTICLCLPIINTIEGYDKASSVSIVKRSFEANPAKNGVSPGQEPIASRYRINANTIIRTHDSRALGAKYLNETELPSNEDCLYWCWETSNCNVAVFEEKTRGSCYLFDCGPNEDFKCKFTPHNFYTSSILQVNKHSYDLSQWGSQTEHEKELVKLRAKTWSASTASPLLMLKSSSPPTRSLMAPATNTPTTAIPAKCQHFQFECRNHSECIAIYNVCDGIPQCPDGSDEAPDLECHKATALKTRFNGAAVATSQQRTTESVDNRQPFLGSAQKSQPPSNNYNYPKTPDVDPNQQQQLMDERIYPKKHSAVLTGSDLRGGPVMRNNWNQFNYQQDLYSDTKTGGGAYLDPDLVREAGAGQPSYWNKQLDTGDQSMANQPLLRLAGAGKTPEEWLQADQQQFYDSIKSLGLAPQRESRPRTASGSAQETAGEGSAAMEKSAPVDGNSNNQLSSAFRRQQLASQRLEQQLRFESRPSQNSALLDGRLSGGHRQRVVAVSLMHDSLSSSGRQTNSAVIALTLGVVISALLVVLVGCRMRSIRTRIARRGPSLAHDADYLVNGMYL